MDIIIVQSDVLQSTIRGLKVSALPEGLREKVIGLLEKLKHVKKVVITGMVDYAIFEIGEQKVTSKFFPEGIRSNFCTIIYLCRWYFQSHWTCSPPEVKPPKWRCADCGWQVEGNKPAYCPIPSCYSHERWQKIIGPSYEPPTKSPLDDLELIEH